MNTSTKTLDYVYSQLLVEPTRTGWNIVWPDGSYFMGPYKTAAAAKSELTKFRKA